MATLVPRSAGSEKRAAVEAAVLAATEELLAEGRVFPDLRIEQIATRAGISRTAFYFYFRGKRELLMRLAERVVANLYAQGERWWGADGDGRDELRRALERAADIWGEHGVLMRAVVDASAYDPAVGQFWREVMERFVEASRVRIEADALPVPAGPTAFALCWMTERAFYESIAAGGDPRDPELLDGVREVWMRTLYP